MKRYRRIRVAAWGAVGLGLLTGAVACAGHEAASTPVTHSSTSGLAQHVIEVRRDPGCGCCTSWVEYLREHDAVVEVRDDPDRDAFRAEVGITDDAASCHTAMVDGYAIEGHVPIEAIERLLADRPDVAGLALPGMPADSPGMGGGPSDWARLAVVAVGDDGTLEPFGY